MSSQTQGKQIRVKFPQTGITSSETMTTKPSCSTFWMTNFHRCLYIVCIECDHCCQRTRCSMQSAINLAFLVTARRHTYLCTCTSRSWERQQSVHGHSQRNRCSSYSGQCCSNPSKVTGQQQLWIAFDQGQNMRWIPVYYDMCFFLPLEETSLFFLSTCEECCIPDRLHIESGNGVSTRKTESC